MNRRIRIALFFAVLLVLSLACSSVGADSEVEVPASTQPELIWSEDFVSQDLQADGWKLNWDGHVDEVCEDITTTGSDIALSVETSTYMDGDGYAGHLTANPHSRPGQYVSAIASYPLASNISQVENGQYVVSGYLGAAPGAGLELVDISVEIVNMENGKPTAYYGELFYYLNSWLTESQKWQLELEEDVSLPHFSGLVYTRSGPDEVIPLHNIGDDRQWHYFELAVTVDKTASYGNQFMIDRLLFVDGQDRVHLTTVDAPMWREVKPDGYSSGMQLFLETMSMNTNCDPSMSFRGDALFDALKIVRYPLREQVPLMDMEHNN